MRSSTYPPLVLFSLLAAMPAQITTTAHLVSGAVSVGTLVAAMPAPGNIGNGFSRSCSGFPGSSYLATGQASTPFHVDILWSAGCQATSTGVTVAQATMRYDFSTPQPFMGRLVATWTPSTSGTGSTLLELDLGADGSVEGNGSAVLPVAFGPGTVSLQVRVSCQATAGGISGPFGVGYTYQGAAAGTLSVRLEPGYCQSQAAGPACGITEFAARGTFLHGVELAGLPTPADEIAVLAIGFGPAATIIPLPPGCLLQVDPVILESQFVDPGDRAAWTIALGPALLPVTCRAQLFGLDLHTFQVLGSHSLLIQLQ